MSLLVWGLLGFIAGFIASKIVDRTGPRLELDIFFGIVGAVVGGSLFTILGMEGATAAVVGAAILLAAYQTLSRAARQAGVGGRKPRPLSLGERDTNG
ncbi:MAG TPA: GlsB/YeaQ/YmgE family stress response membrane protein [Candidatus Sulfotelmatobacter sp.]|nr:GlsB/YeaQ/YmgE family stress response membrane protein [Candidatus Sulfotelmatobacter sp.]